MHLYLTEVSFFLNTCGLSIVGDKTRWEIWIGNQKNASSMLALDSAMLCNLEIHLTLIYSHLTLWKIRVFVQDNDDSKIARILLLSRK